MTSLAPIDDQRLITHSDSIMCHTSGQSVTTAVKYNDVVT